MVHIKGEKSMRKKKVEKIKSNIVLSIKYARLSEEVRDTEIKKLDLAQKKMLIGSKEKIIDKNNQFIDNINTAINKIEQNNNSNNYSLIINNQMNEQLKLLSKNKDFELIKYGIAIEIIMDDDFDYTNTNKDFIENISLMLFNDKNIMKKIEDDYKRIANRIYGTNLKNFFESAANSISKIQIKNLFKAAVYTSKNALVIIGTAAFGFGLGSTYFKLRKQAKKMGTLSSGDLATILIINALNLLYAKEHFEYKTDYNNYFKYILAEINMERKFIMKEIFEEQYEIEANTLKIRLLHNFDDYLLEQMNLEHKKKAK
jgi:hypothetical protein